MTTITVKPALGRKVRNAAGAIVPAAGVQVSDQDPYWYRRIQMGDVVVVPAAQKAPPAPAAKLAPAPAPAESADPTKKSK